MNLREKAILCILSLVVLFLTIGFKDLKQRIEDLENNQNNFQEYILNMIENSRIEWNDIGCKAQEINQS